MPLASLTHLYLPAIEDHLRQAVARVNGPHYAELHAMMSYHLGWEGKGAGPDAQGKRIRPLVVLLTAAAAGGQWQRALPAAAAVELIHNFSLIHDDIEDNSPVRRGRATLWTLWGIPQAINTGDAMFALAHLILLDLAQDSRASVTLQAAQIMQRACLELTQGQYLDMSYEKRRELPIAAYWPMVSGKTAALLAACTELGALVAEAEPETRQAYYHFGRDLGLAFQALDDLLGIWGDAEKIGKSATSDLVEGKKSLPILYGLQQQGAFARRWLEGPISPEEVPQLAQILAEEGARDFTQCEANRLTDAALHALLQANPQGEAGQALHQMANHLLRREV